MLRPSITDNCCIYYIIPHDWNFHLVYSF
jgi:hypothetical protein